MLTWEEKLRREKELYVKCREVVEKVFPKNLYEIKFVSAVVQEEPTPRHPYTEACIVDFERKKTPIYVDCEEYCHDYTWSEAEYKRCVKTCKENLKIAKRGSIAFNPDTLQIYESTIPGSCKYVWFIGEPYSPEEKKWQEKREKLFEKFRKIGCEIIDNWIHPHELAGLGWEAEEWEELPAICYYHPRAEFRVEEKDGKHVFKFLKGCNLKDVLKLIEEEV